MDGRRVYLLDLDNTRKSAHAVNEQTRDLARFTVNAEEMNIGSQMYEQFLDAYNRDGNEPLHELVERMMPFIYQFRATHLPRYGSHGQRLL